MRLLGSGASPMLADSHGRTPLIAAGTVLQVLNIRISHSVLQLYSHIVLFMCSVYGTLYDCRETIRRWC